MCCPKIFQDHCDQNQHFYMTFSRTNAQIQDFSGPEFFHPISGLFRTHGNPVSIFIFL